MKKPGFTLLEIMVAIALISIVLVTVLRLNSQTIAMNSHAKFYTTAPLLLQQKINEMDLEGDYEGLARSGDFGEEHPGYSWELSVTDVFSDTLGSVSQQLKKFDWTVYFNQGRFVYRSSVIRFVGE